MGLLGHSDCRHSEEWDPRAGRLDSASDRSATDHMHQTVGKAGGGEWVADVAERLANERQTGRNTCRVEFGDRSFCWYGRDRGGQKMYRHGVRQSIEESEFNKREPSDAAVDWAGAGLTGIWDGCSEERR